VSWALGADTALLDVVEFLMAFCVGRVSGLCAMLAPWAAGL
jgi:formylmethanofuran dehydrogenase subunit E-like metal-binding protein